MIFYYDPILGLDYRFVNPIVYINVLSIPPSFDIDNFKEQWYEYQKNIGISFYSTEEVQELPFGIISNF